MHIGAIRPTKTISLETEAHSLADAHDALEKDKPSGFELTSAAVKMSNGTMPLAATGTFARRDGASEIEAPDMNGRAAVPDGWTLLHVRSV